MQNTIIIRQNNEAPARAGFWQIAFGAAENRRLLEQGSSKIEAFPVLRHLDEWTAFPDELYYNYCHCSHSRHLKHSASGSEQEYGMPNPTTKKMIQNAKKQKRAIIQHAKSKKTVQQCNGLLEKAKKIKKKHVKRSASKKRSKGKKRENENRKL